MLSQLAIKDFALIEDLKVEFSKGLNILTGETGAGKSIIVDALNLTLGERAQTEQIRTGSDIAVLEALFDISDTDGLRDILDRYGIRIGEDNLLVIRREVNKEGRSRCYVNGSAMTLLILKDLGDRLVDIHGQHEHQSILKEENHINLLDAFGSLEDKRGEITSLYRKLGELKDELKRLEDEEKEFNRNIDFLQFQLREIENARLEPDEDLRLEEERVILENAEELFSKASRAYSLLYEGGGETSTVLDSLSVILEDLNDIAGIDENISQLAKACEEAIYQLEDVALSLRSYIDKITFDPDRLEEVEGRLNLIKDLKKKYGATVEDILNFGDSLRKKLDSMAMSGERKEKIKKEIEGVKGKLSSLVGELSEERKRAADALKTRVENELKSLGMKNTIFQVKMTNTQDKEGDVLIGENRYRLYPDGIDLVEFMISPNIGEELKPLRKIASGGEMSRIMLAIKTILADADKIPTMVFDEIDAGIGGGIAEVVGRKLSAISSNRQAICITHLPQIASMADAHYSVQKRVVSKRTITECKKLTSKERIKEIARMLGGVEITDITLKHAKEMIEKNEEMKKYPQLDLH